MATSTQRKNGKCHLSGPRPEPRSPEQATRLALAAVFANLGIIVQAMIDKAVDGSHLHAKLLFEFAGISTASLSPDTESEPQSLAQLLMDKLDRMAEESASTEDERPVE